MSQHGTPGVHADSATLRKVTTAAVAGTVIEWFDFAIYGFMAPIIAVTFFPEGNRVAGLLQTFAIFAVAFALRPGRRFRAAGQGTPATPAVARPAA